MDEDRYRHRYREMRLNGRIVITAIVCLFFVVVIVVLLYIYARCVLRRQARRRAALRQLGIPVGTTTTMAQMNEPKRGLSESVITSLPSFVYKNVDHMNNSGNPIECSVCLCTLEDEEIARLLPNCKHTFHAECIDMWLNSHSTCPICRTEAEPSDQLQQQQPAAESVIELGQLSGAGGVPAAVATAPAIEGTSSNSAKVGRTESSSRLSSFRRMLSRERTETTTRIQQTDHRERTESTTTRIQQTDHGVRDIEWQ